VDLIGILLDDRLLRYLRCLQLPTCYQRHSKFSAPHEPEL